MSRALVAWVLLVAVAAASAAEQLPSGVTVHRDVVYAEVDGHRLLLDLYLPADAENPPLVLWIHGGSWRAGDHKRCYNTWLAEEGFALASISYRLTDRAPFPAQIHDCKGAVRWLRAQADRYGYNAARVGVTGASAGGHLAVLLGTSADVPELEGTTAGHLDQSSRVDAVVDYYGATDFILRSQNQPSRANAVGSGVYLLLGGPASEKTNLARLASGVTHVSADDPPLLILHGAKDNKVFVDQAERIDRAYRQAGREVNLHVLPDAGHGGNEFYTGDNRRRVVEFLTRHLRGPSDE